MSAASERMRTSRERRRDGFRCVRLDIHRDEIEALVQRGLLAPEERADHDAVAVALGDLMGAVLTDAASAPMTGPGR